MLKLEFSQGLREEISDGFELISPKIKIDLLSFLMKVALSYLRRK
jgi:hypothetical protein